ncbi:MAG TPA: hypothetical protein ENL03_02600, partial [Phycisphaerae bacterium]|nr:hypothetical protein [Phycisphaerae bacterium]
MSYMLEIIGKGLDIDFHHVLSRLYWTPQEMSAGDPTPYNADRPKPFSQQIRLGISLLNEAEPAGAIHHLNIALDSCDNKQIRTALACAYEDIGQTAEALKHLSAATDMTGGREKGIVYFAMGFCCEKLGKKTVAADNYRKSIEADDSYTPASYRLAAVSLIIGDIAEAIRQYSALREAEPENSWLR